MPCHNDVAGVEPYPRGRLDFSLTRDVTRIAASLRREAAGPPDAGMLYQVLSTPTPTPKTWHGIGAWFWVEG